MSSFRTSNRGGFGRGRGGFNRSSYPPRDIIKPDIQKHPLGTLLQTVTVSSLEAQQNNVTSNVAIRELEYIASYNWLDANNPTILVPGKPPQWTPLQTARRLSEDKGDYFRDPNAARIPEYPTAPAVQAVLGTSPDFHTTSIDLFACGSTLGNLLRFVRGMDKAFRFSVEVIGQTIFFTRKENDPRETIQGIRGFGHTFPEAYTTWENEVRGSETHQRIVQYKLGQLKCLVRFECDGYIKDKNPTNAKLSGSRLRGEEVGHAVSEDKLLAALDGTTISQSIRRAPEPLDYNLIMQQRGLEVSQDSVFDLKTRSGKYKKEIDMEEMFPTLWMKQIPNFIIAYHDGHGLFEDIRVQNVKQGIQKWEQDNMDAIRRLSLLLDKILEVAKDDNIGLLEIYFDGTSDLQIRRQHGNGKYALPAILMEKWAADKTVAPDASPDEENGYRDPNLRKGGHWQDLRDGDSYDEYGYENEEEEEELDFTACSAEDCGYCGKCTY